MTPAPLKVPRPSVLRRLVVDLFDEVAASTGELDAGGALADRIYFDLIDGPRDLWRSTHPRHASEAEWQACEEPCQREHRAAVAAAVEAEAAFLSDDAVIDALAGHLRAALKRQNKIARGGQRT